MPKDEPCSAVELIDEGLVWLRETYRQHRFFTERDIVWTLQRRLAEAIARKGLDLYVYNDFPIIRGTRGSQSVDLAILSRGDVDAAARGPNGWLRGEDILSMTGRPILAVLDFKYEPALTRGKCSPPNIWPSKFPVVFWNDPTGSVTKDVERCREYAQRGLSELSMSLFIDEGSLHRKRPAPAGTIWEDWDVVADSATRCSVLIGRFSPTSRP